MADIYSIDFSLQTENILPPNKRLPKILAFFIGFITSIQILRDWFYDYYADGFTGDAWDVGTSYVAGEQVRYIDHSVYECIDASTAGILPTDTTKWVKIQDIYIGLRERLRYNSRKILLEFILNKWFEVAVLPADQIYITNNNIYGTGFLMGETGETSSYMSASSASSASFLVEEFALGENAFTIYVPVAVFNALDADPTNAENIIRSIADKYVIAGMIYNIVTY